IPTYDVPTEPAPTDTPPPADTPPPPPASPAAPVVTAAPPAQATPNAPDTPPPTPTPPESHYTADGKLRLNLATAAELASLPGIGEVLSQRIVDYRAAHGPFRTVAGVKNVSGIGSGRYEPIKDLLSVE
ncbi:MAG: helix-hairpin-helix domain-containing protein, partial [Oscillospiraceae bacterium]|nr:helix-hairpin-helix domain-containing protein [Oscillospiraceae bacterium]